MEKAVQYLEKAGPFIGPRGGKWADSKHTIPWKEGGKTSTKDQTPGAGSAQLKSAVGYAQGDYYNSEDTEKWLTAVSRGEKVSVDPKRVASDLGYQMSQAEDYIRDPDFGPGLGAESHIEAVDKLMVFLHAGGGVNKTMKKSMEYDVMSIATVEEVEELVKATCGSKTAYKGMSYKGYDMEKADDEEEEEEEMDPALAEAAKDDPSLLEDEEKSVKKAWETILDLEKAGPFIGKRGGKWADSKHTIPWKESKHAGKAEPKSKGHDESGARELQLHVENTYSHYNQHESIRDNLVKKIANGKYDHAQASKLFEYLAESGSKSYSKEFGAPAGGGHHFDPATRRAVARQMANDFHDEVKDGEHDHRLKGVHAKRAKAGGGISKMAHGHMKKSLSKGMAMMVCSMCGHSQPMESSISVSEEPHMTNLTVDGGHPNGGVTQEASTSDLMLKGVHGHNLEILSRMDPDTAVYVLMNKDMIDKANGY
jgi:hypothetical protein